MDKQTHALHNIRYLYSFVENIQLLIIIYKNKKKT